MTYQEQMKSPKWQRKRLEVLELRGFKCQECGRSDHQLHVHHPKYRRGAMIWEYAEWELQCLCDECHDDAHGVKRGPVYTEEVFMPPEGAMRRYRERCAANAASKVATAQTVKREISSDACGLTGEAFFKKMADFLQNSEKG